MRSAENSSRAANGGCLTLLKSSGLHTTGFATGHSTGKFVLGESSREVRGSSGPTAKSDGDCGSSLQTRNEATHLDDLCMIIYCLSIN